ncbi:MAG: hypothetical protein ABI612_21975 [Betaproteobacteria bacterium]
MNDRLTPRRSLPHRVAWFLRFRGSDQQMLEDIAQRLQDLIAADSLSDRLHAFTLLFDWARSGEASSESTDSGTLSPRAVHRWTLLLDFLDAHDDIRTRVQSAISEALAETEGSNLFGAAGLPSGRGFIAGFGDRLMQRLLPEVAEEHDLARLLHRLYSEKSHVERFARLPPALFTRLADLLRPAAESDIRSSLRNDFADGFRLLATRVQAEGLAPKLRARSAHVRVSRSPFYLQQHAADALLQNWIAEDVDISAHSQAWRDRASACRKATTEIAHRLESAGVSVDIVYSLDVIDRCLTRMELMASFMESEPGAQRDAVLHILLALLIGATLQDRSIAHLTRSNLQLLGRKIVDRSGKTGEHYIAWTRAEYWLIWRAAAGGGLLTMFTAAIKMMIVGAGMALFIEGVVGGFNYAVSFLLLQMFGLVLATKQPAMTAAALANIMRTQRGAERLDEVVDYSVQICRSQIAAAIANVAIVSVGAYAFSTLWQLAMGRPFLDAHEAEHVFQSLSPIASGTVWYAALTGVVLWAAGLIGGWFDNWAVYHRLPEAIAAHRLGQRFGRRRMNKIAGLVSRNIAGWATNISLGFMLGLAPVIGKFLGLPLDVRHVTLSSGILAFAATSLGDAWLRDNWFVWAAVGIGTMFVLNLGVSFLLSLYTAARAYGLPRSFMLDYARAVGARFLRRPGDFVLPPTASAKSPDH